MALDRRVPFDALRVLVMIARRWCCVQGCVQPNQRGYKMYDSNVSAHNVRVGLLRGKLMTVTGDGVFEDAEMSVDMMRRTAMVAHVSNEESLLELVEEHIYTAGEEHKIHFALDGKDEKGRHVLLVL